MARFAAFLRAVNVGGRIVKMERLRGTFEALGFSAVETFIASGNVLFSTSSRSGSTLERRIAAQLRESLGYEVATFVRTVDEVGEIAAYDPFTASVAKPYHAIYVLFLPAAPPAAARRALAALASEDDELHVHGRELYWLARKSFRESAVTAALLERTLGMPATARNLTTVKKLAAKCVDRRQ